MRKLVFGILFTNLLTLQNFQSKGNTGQETGDTVIIRLKNKNQVMIITENSKNLESFKSVNLNKLIADIDSTFKTEEALGNPAMLNMEVRKKDSVLRIQVLKPQMESDKNAYKAVVRIIEKEEANDDTIRREVRNARDGRNINFQFSRNKNRKNRIDDAFEIDLGWNNYLDANGNLPSDQNRPEGLRPMWSNIVTLRAQKHFFFRPTKKTSSLSAGLEVSWNNFKFDNDVIIVKGPEQVVFEPFPADQKKIKSKLALCWLNLPIMLHYHAPKSSFHLAAGGFVGYRLTSWSKTKYDKEGDTKKDHVSTNFYLNSLQYGARVQVGLWGVDLFAQYNFNELFSKGKGPVLTPFAFGFTL
jgi:hypothetical protein